MFKSIKKFLNDAVDTTDYKRQENAIKHQFIRSTIETTKRIEIDVAKLKQGGKK